MTIVRPSRAKISARESLRGSLVSNPAPSSIEATLEQRPARQRQGERAVVAAAADARARRRPPQRPLLRGLGDVEPLEVEREAGGRVRPAEPPEQLVVAAAAADALTDGGVVDLEDRAGVVAEIAEQAEVDLDAIGDPGGLERGERLGERRRCPLDRRPPSERARSSTSGPPRRLLSATIGRPLGLAEVCEVPRLGLDRDEVMGGEAVEDARPWLHPRRRARRAAAEQVGVAEADHRALQADGVERRDEDLGQLAVPAGASAPISSTPICRTRGAGRAAGGPVGRRCPSRRAGTGRSVANRRATRRAIGTVMSLRSASTEPDSSKKR